ncbi:D-Ala-D-Ala carboxypeptidase VanY [Xylanibacillus composti]|uniref:D-Ala-D-Ala carboxypeptidase VanY n=1 Tax=Xylanibacillus composti TaxID=1572762 RepID=A0A8J4H6M3_9BACL|nr:M15 family metallopeptidase [Xylanibacillus composti]GIQ69668.1 D-Ala-D-Ala carboxypeptidase VanY [Xylanibacillus composti]
MKKWFFLFVLLFIFGYGFTQFLLEDKNETLPEIDYQVEAVVAEENEIPIPVTIDHIYQGNLLLVNKDYPVPPGAVEKNEAVTLAHHREWVNGFVLLDNDIRLTPYLLQTFSTMVEAANQDGVNHLMLSSGYRDEEEQSELYRKMGPAYALKAGHSEHNLGLSLDIGSTQGEMEYAAEGKWLKANSWKYGYILRYPEDKTAITGIQYEPWHFRYVGMPHSAIMYERNFVLEEYLDFLKEQKSIVATIDELVYEISYYPISQTTAIHVPASGRYEISGNNMDGVIVTVSRNRDEQIDNEAAAERNS